MRCMKISSFKVSNKACFMERVCDSQKSLRCEMRPALNLKKISTNSCTETCEKFEEKHNMQKNKYECGEVKEIKYILTCCCGRRTRTCFIVDCFLKRLKKNELMLSVLFSGILKGSICNFSCFVVFFNLFSMFLFYFLLL